MAGRCEPCSSPPPTAATRIASRRHAPDDVAGGKRGNNFFAGLLRRGDLAGWRRVSQQDKRGCES